MSVHGYMTLVGVATSLAVGGAFFRIIRNWFRFIPALVLGVILGCELCQFFATGTLGFWIMVGVAFGISYALFYSRLIPFLWGLVPRNTRIVIYIALSIFALILLITIFK